LRADVLLALYRSGAAGAPQDFLDLYDQYLFCADYLAAVLRAPSPKASDAQGRLIRKDMAYRHQFLRDQLRAMEETFLHVPETQVKDFVRAANAEKRPHCLRLIYRSIEASILPTNAARFVDLCRASDPGVARLGTATVLELVGGEAGRSIASALTDEMRRAPISQRRRVLVLARLLPPEDRRRMAEIGLADPEPSVKRVAQGLLNAMSATPESGKE
jgi:hypothetical protein